MSLISKLRRIRTWGQGVALGLPDVTLERDPIELFGEWFEAAGEAGIRLPEAMGLATSTPDGQPSLRMVLLKGFDERGFVFFTNYGSRKAGEIERNPRVALVLYWNALDRQVRIEGTVQRVTPEESAAYFATRPRGSRLAAWASSQSERLPDRGELERRFHEMERRYDARDVPLPGFWGGYRVAADRIEFWQGRADRLHDRVAFARREDGAGCESFRLYP
jgi:pyridoxamine 5'-phosphate oxidase